MAASSTRRCTIPDGLSLRQCEVYQTLIHVAEGREERGQGPRPIVVISDVGKDYDDAAALLVLKEFHRLGHVELRAVVANLMPADKRTRLARAWLDALGLQNVPVGRGTRGKPDEEEELELEYEFSWNDFVMPADVPQRDGQDLLLEAYQHAKAKGEKLYLLCLSSLQDIHKFASAYPDLVAHYTAEVHMQGGNYISSEGKLEPDRSAANNRYNWEAARAWHSFLQKNALPSYTYTKAVAFAAALSSEVFVELEASGHPIGSYLRRVQVEQDLAFYKQACESDPEKRFAPFMDQQWFLVHKTNWQQRPNADLGAGLPIGEEVIPYLSKIVLYDVHGALGVSGEDVIEKLGIFRSRDRSIEVELKSTGKVVRVHHWIADDEQSVAVPDKVHAVLSALLKGSLLDALRYSNL